MPRVVEDADAVRVVGARHFAGRAHVDSIGNDGCRAALARGVVARGHTMTMTMTMLDGRRVDVAATVRGAARMAVHDAVYGAVLS